MKNTLGSGKKYIDMLILFQRKIFKILQGLKDIQEEESEWFLCKKWKSC